MSGYRENYPGDSPRSEIMTLFSEIDRFKIFISLSFILQEYILNFFNYPEKNVKNTRQCADQDFLDWPTKWWGIFLLSNVKSRKKCQTLLGACFAIGTEYVALLFTSSKYSIQSCFLIFCKIFSICSFRCGTISAVIEFGSWIQIINLFPNPFISCSVLAKYFIFLLSISK